MADAPSPPFELACPWCDFYIVVNARGGRGSDLGSGVEAARLMEHHVIFAHQKTWKEFLAHELARS
jgi:hypothetical protein